MPQVNLKKLKEIRKKNKRTLKDMADLLGYKSPSGWHYVETGRCKLQPQHIPVICKEFNIDLGDIFFNA